MVEEDIVPKLDAIFLEEPFLKEIKALGGKALEGVPLFSGKMDIDLVRDWLEGMEKHFECEGILDAQNIKVAKSCLRGSTLIWWKCVQDERVGM